MSGSRAGTFSHEPRPLLLLLSHLITNAPGVLLVCLPPTRTDRASCPKTRAGWLLGAPSPHRSGPICRKGHRRGRRRSGCSVGQGDQTLQEQHPKGLVLRAAQRTRTISKARTQRRRMDRSEPPHDHRDSSSRPHAPHDVPYPYDPKRWSQYQEELGFTEGTLESEYREAFGLGR